jgi:hypothetical protein
MRWDSGWQAAQVRNISEHDMLVSMPAQPALPERVEVPVMDEKGKLQAYMAWTPLDPGCGMLHRMANMVLLGLLPLLPLLAIAAIELRRIFQAARWLIERERFAPDGNALTPSLGDFARRNRD